MVDKADVSCYNNEPRAPLPVIQEGWGDHHRNLRAHADLARRPSLRDPTNYRRLGTLPSQKNKWCGQRNSSV